MKPLTKAAEPANFGSGFEKVPELRLAPVPKIQLRATQSRGAWFFRAVFRTIAFNLNRSRSWLASKPAPALSKFFAIKCPKRAYFIAKWYNFESAG